MRACPSDVSGCDHTKAATTQRQPPLWDPTHPLHLPRLLQGVDAVTPTEVVDADGTVQVITTNKPSTTVTASTGAAGVRSSVGSGLVATAAGAAALLLLLA